MDLTNIPKGSTDCTNIVKTSTSVTNTNKLNYPAFLAWMYRVKITINKTKVGGDLANYPVYLDLSLYGDTFWNNVQNGGGDIRITTSDGATECAREVVSCDTATRTGEVHALLPAVSSTVDTVFYLYYGNISATEPLANSAYGSEAVWVNYAYVAHLENKNLSKPAGSQFTEFGSPSYDSAKLGKGLHVSAKENHLKLLNVFSSFASKDWIIQVWFKQASIYTSNVYSEQIPIFAGFQADPLIYLNLRTSSYHFRYINLTNDRTASRNQVANSFVQLRGNFTQPRTVKLQYNNDVGNTQTLSNLNMVNLAGNDLFIGGHPTFNGAPSLERYIDEFRISNTAQSENYYTAEYNNQNSPATFYSSLYEVLKTDFTNISK